MVTGGLIGLGSCRCYCCPINWRTGTQLTMRTFHTGGIAGKDLQEVCSRCLTFEARTPKGAALLARTSGVIG